MCLWRYFSTICNLQCILYITREVIDSCILHYNVSFPKYSHLLCIAWNINSLLTHLLLCNDIMDIIVLSPTLIIWLNTFGIQKLALLHYNAEVQYRNKSICVLCTVYHLSLTSAEACQIKASSADKSVLRNCRVVTLRRSNESAKVSHHRR